MPTRSRSRAPSLSVLRSFDAAARHQSYTMAAEELGITQGAVSRQVRDLEEAIGTALFRRVGRTVRLTEAGRALAGELRIDLDRLSQTVARAVAAGESARILSVAVLPTLAARWLVPRLPGFRAAHPGVELALSSHTQPFDLARARIDLAIHFGRPDWPGARLVPLFSERLLAVAAPDLIARHGEVERAPAAEILSRVPLVHLTSRPEAWQRHLGLTRPAPRALPGMRCDLFSMVIAAAVAGLGAALVPAFLIQAELASGALVQIGDSPPGGEDGYFIATPLGAENRAAAQFAAWLRREAAVPPTEAVADPVPHDGSDRRG